MQTSKLATDVTPIGILSKKLEQLLQLISDTPAIPKEALRLSGECYELAAGLEAYLQANTTPPSKNLKMLDEATRAEDWEQNFSSGKTSLALEYEMLSGHVEGQVLKMITYMTRAESILEIGMFTGYSALAMAEALPSTGRLIACEIDEYVASIAKKHFQASPYGKKITIKTGEARESIRDLSKAGECFDLIFIDGNKIDYWMYYQVILDANLIAPGGFICVDNTLFQAQPYLNRQDISPNGSAIAHFNQKVAADDRVEQVILPLRDGLTIIRRI